MKNYISPNAIQVVYKISSSCWQVYIEKTMRTLETYLTEHQAATRIWDKKISHCQACLEQHHPSWDETTILDHWTRWETATLSWSQPLIKISENFLRLNISSYHDCRSTQVMVQKEALFSTLGAGTSVTMPPLQFHWPSWPRRTSLTM